MNDYFLILYVGNDYIVPIIDSLKGDMYEYRQGDDNRLWLYFHEETDTTDVSFGRENFRYSMMEKESYFGRYWENVSAEKTVSIHGVKAHYQDLVKLSGLTDTLANFYHGIVPGTADIPTVCIFDDSIDPRARLKFLKVISNCGFRTVSYSTSFNSLTALYFNGDVFGRSELSDSTEGFGKKIVTISASGTSVNISALIYLDGSFVTCSDTMRIPTGGENPVKEALVRHIVDENNRTNGFLTPEGVRREYLYQMQYAEEWLKLANETDDNSSFKVSYHLSIDPEISYSLNISKSFILRKQAELVKPVSDGLAKFCSGMNASDISAYLFMGEMFETEQLYELLAKISTGKSHYISSIEYPEILHKYLKVNAGLTEDPKNFDKVTADRTRAANSARLWSTESGKILSLKKALTEIVPDFKLRVQSFKNKCSSALASMSSALETSNFNQADDHLGSQDEERQMLKNHIVQNIMSVIDQQQALRQLLMKVSEYPFAKKVVSEINELHDSIEELSKVYDEQCHLLEEGKAKVSRFRECYPKYKKLRADFESASGLEEKRRILNEMSGLTGEPLPEDPSEVNGVTVELSGDVEYKKSLFSKKPVKVNIKMRITGCGILPYNCVLVVSGSPISFIDRRCTCIDIPKGTERSFQTELALPLPDASDGKYINARLFIDDEKEKMYDPAKVSSNILYINI